MDDGEHEQDSPLVQRLERDDALQRALARDLSAELLENCIRLRRHRGLSQAELADRMGTSQSFVSRLERGLTNPRASTIERIAEVLDAAIRLELVPWEQWREVRRQPRWWSARSHPFSASVTLRSPYTKTLEPEKWSLFMHELTVFVGEEHLPEYSEVRHVSS